MTQWYCELSELQKFVDTAKPREMFRYYTGPCIQNSLLAKNIGSVAYDEASRGNIYLVQKRRSDHTPYFDYFAIKASKPPVYRLIPLPVGKISELKTKPKYRIRRRYVTGARNGETISIKV